MIEVRVTEPGFPPPNEEVLAEANKYVRGIEMIGLERMATARIQTKHRAEGCGCHQCRRGAIGADERYNREFSRLFPNHPEDQEELWISNRYMR